MLWLGGGGGEEGVRIKRTLIGLGWKRRGKGGGRKERDDGWIV